MIIEFDVQVQMVNHGGKDPSDRWSADSFSGTVHVNGARITTEDNFDCLHHEDAAVGQTVYLVLAVYTTGDSFHSCGGQYELCSVWKDATNAYDDLCRLEKSTDSSLPWVGYFEHLDSLQVITLILEKE